MKYYDFIANDSKLDEINELVSSFCVPLNFSNKDKMQILISIEEVFVNIAHYAYYPNTGNVTLGLDNKPNLVIEFKDQGIKFNPLEKVNPDLTSDASKRSIGGLGIYMVKKYMDEVSYEYSNGFNILRLVKYPPSNSSSYKLDYTNLIIYLDGRIDSANANDIEEKINNIRNANRYESIELDAKNLNYISSAGLRIILRLKKDVNDLRISNVNNDVYEIFEMTGFNEMINITKAYRNISIEGCEVIGQGSNGKVYRLDNDTIIKVYLNPSCLDDIKRERELARKAFVLGIPTAIPYDVVKVNETYGSVFELLNAKSFTKLINADESNFDKCVDMSIDLLKKIHGTTINPNDMPNEKDVVIGWVNFLKDYLPTTKANKLIKLVEDVPTCYKLMHGDYHIKNVMLQNNEVLLIDMDTLCYGDKIFEFASMFNAYDGFSYGLRDDEITFLGIRNDLAKKFFIKSLEKYYNTTDKSIIDDVYNKSALIGYSRIMRRTIRRDPNSQKGKELIEHCKEEIIRLLDVVDNLKV